MRFRHREEEVGRGATLLRARSMTCLCLSGSYRSPCGWWVTHNGLRFRGGEPSISRQRPPLKAVAGRSFPAIRYFIFQISFSTSSAPSAYNFSSSPNLLPQRSLQRDLRNAGKCLRQRTVALHRSRDLLELRLVDAGHRGLQRQRNAVDHEAVALL